MTITNIKQQLKRNDRYSIYGDGKYIFSLSESELLNLGIKIGQEFDDKELKELKDKATLDKAYDRCLNLILRRARSEWEVRNYLVRREYSKEVIDITLNRLRQQGYIDDVKFAAAWIENRRLLKPTSKRKLKMELKQKGVADGSSEIALQADEGDEKEILKELILKKRTQSRYREPQKLLAYLSRQGFNYSDIKDILKQLED